jgi:phosphoglycerate dehydrogenase-like enzyme
MATITEVVATLRYATEDRRRVEALFAPAPVRWDPEALTTADVAVLGSDFGPEVAAAPRLRWVHCDHAGLDGSATAAALEAGIVVTSAAGRSAPAVAEHALLFMLALAYEYPRFLRAQRLRVWGIRGQADLRALWGRTVAVVGTGHTGRALAVRCAALGLRVLGHRRRDLPVEGPFERVTSADRGERVDGVLAEADFTVLTAGLNDGSHHLIGSSQLAAIGPGAYLVNVGRGALVDEAALVAALRSGRLAGAATDVTSVEPLPIRSPLWRAPNLLLTPHVTARAADRTDRGLAILAANVAHYRRDEPLENRLGPDDVWSGPPVGRADGASAGWRRLARRVI